jgi:ABC-type Fe3+-hydroxamate transport system substrate-binding protein
VPSAESRRARAPRDDFGTVVPDGHAHRPTRIVSLNPGTTELLFAIGAGPRVVGRTTWDVWPDSARAVPDLGPGMRPNVEAVLARAPDLVLLYASDENRAAARQLVGAHIPVLALKVDRIEDFRRAARLLGRATDDSARAEAVVDSVSRTLERVRAATAPLAHPSVFWHVWDSPLYTIGAGSFLDELVTIAGARNVYHDLAAPSPQVSLEDIVRRDPDVILAGPEGRARIATSPAWQSVRAVRAGRVLAVDTNLVGRPSVRLGEAAVSLARMLHPELARGALP